MIAYRHRLPMTTFGMPITVILQQIESGRRFSAANMIVAAQRSDITDTMIANVDALLQASEGYFNALTRGHTLTTTLSPRR
jgi:hypothetical protein